SGAKKILLMDIKDVIDARTNRYVTLALEKADNENVDMVIIEMSTPGGALNDAMDINKALLEYEKPIYVFINKDAASAGALLSISCDSIYMSAGARIGAATVVTPDGQAAPDKYQSYMRSIMRSTAEAKGRDPKIAEAMVDETLEVEGVTEAGEIVTFSTSEAIENGFCEAEVSSLDDLYKRLGLEDAEVIHYELPSTEKIIAIFLNPFVSGILILVIVGGIYFELQTPGVGFPILAALIAAILYFTPYYLNGLAENWEIILFFVGLVLIALEVFVIPGFGIAGISGIVLVVGSLMLVMLDNDVFDFSFVPSDKVFTAMFTAFAGVIGAIVVMIIGGVRFTKSAFFTRLALDTVQNAEEGYTSKFDPKISHMDQTGTAYTVLRPSGKITIGDDIYDAYTRGEYIDEGAKVIVIGEEGTSLKVKEIE
ncbi:MAG: NfeD family protein, partial [Cyclobacteriaceae bacterium]